jgi:heterodisulfide reductase subunit C
MLSGKVEPGKNVLVYDGVSTHAGAGVADFMSSRGSNCRDRDAGREGGRRRGRHHVPHFLPPALRARRDPDTPNYWLDKVYEEDGKKIAVLKNEYTEEQEERAVDQVVIENGITPNDEPLLEAQAPESVNKGQTDIDAQAVRLRAAAVFERRARQRPLPALPCRRLHLHAQHPRRDLRRAAPLQGFLTMSPVFVITVLLWLSVAGLAFASSWRAAYWREGRATAAGAYGWANLLTIPKRYFVDLHHVVARDPYMARAHVGDRRRRDSRDGAGVRELRPGDLPPWLDKAIFLAAPDDAGRRCVRLAPASRRESGAGRLSRDLGSFAAYCWDRSRSARALYRAAFHRRDVRRAGGIVALLIAAGAAMTFGAARGGPMKHALAGLLHLAFHPRQERFAERNDKRGAAYRAQAPAARRERIRRGQAGRVCAGTSCSFDACVQCGKCEAACPAFAAGQPLNPKKLIQDLVTGMVGGTDAASTRAAPRPAFRSAGMPARRASRSISVLIEADTLWSCTTCRACVQECPMLIEHVDAIVDMRRNQTLVGRQRAGQRPGSRWRICARRAASNGYDIGARHDWAVDLQVQVAQPGRPSGCAADRGRRRLRHALSAHAARLHQDTESRRARLSRCWAAWKRYGDTAAASATKRLPATRAGKLIGTLSQYFSARSSPPIRTCCTALRNEYRALGGF